MIISVIPLQGWVSAFSRISLAVGPELPDIADAFRERQPESTPSRADGDHRRRKVWCHTRLAEAECVSPSSSS